jgi:beta-xylosidase
MYTSDNLNGTFSNPLIQGDYPDPDIIRVGDDFYLVSSSFTCAPGIPVCHSTDLINWRVIGHAYARLSETNPAYSMVDGAVAYRGGSWAPFIRYNAGKFYIGFCTPAEGFFMCIAERPEGPYEVIPFGTELYDPSMLFDDDGRVYMCHGANGIVITELTPDARGIKGEAVDIFQTPFGTPLEGSHIYKRGAWYYICLTCRGYNGIQTALRSRHIHGPYESRVITADDMNYGGAGLHQGGFVEMANGETWFFLFQDRDYLGRAPVLLPVRWEDDWPLLGDPANYGKVPVTSRKPALPPGPLSLPEGGDEFDAPTLHLRWHWNHNPDDTRWSLSERPGWLRLKANAAPAFLQARNTLMQKIIGPTTRADTRLDFSALRPGAVAGLAVVNIPYAFIGVALGDDARRVIVVHDGQEMASAPVPENAWEIHFRADIDAAGEAHFSFGFDGANFQPLGPGFVLQFTVKTFLGNRFGLFCYTTASSPAEGHADFDYLHLPALQPAHRYNAFSEIPAVGYDHERGTDTQRITEKRPMQNLINLNEGDWVLFDQVDFGDGGAAHFIAHASPIRNGGRIEVRLGDADGELLGTCDIPPDGNVHDWAGTFRDYACSIRRVTGMQAICLRFRGAGKVLYRLKSFRFGE